VGVWEAAGGDLPVVRLLTHGLPHFAWLAVLPATGQGQLLPAHPVMHTHASHGWRYVVMATIGWLLQHEAVTKPSCSLGFDEATPHTHSVEKQYPKAVGEAREVDGEEDLSHIDGN